MRIKEKIEWKVNLLISEQKIHKIKKEVHEFLNIFFPDGRKRICNELFAKNYLNLNKYIAQNSQGSIWF